MHVQVRKPESRCATASAPLPRATGENPEAQQSRFPDALTEVPSLDPRPSDTCQASPEFSSEM